MAAEVGHLQLAFDYTAEAAFMDLEDREHNTKDGLHIASLAGTWLALVSGFGGMRAGRDGLSFLPQLPPGLAGLSFRMRYRGRVLLVKVGHGTATYSLIDGDPLPISHHGQQLTVAADPVSMDIPAPRQLPTPIQPAGRVPTRRGRTD
jgi:alpha,alpha-trehalose phosphorylase